MKVSSSAADGFARRPDRSCVLVYGPDHGLVRERVTALAQSVLGKDLADPFRSADLQGTAVAADCALLVDEAAALALTGSRRVVRVSNATDGSAEAFATVLKVRAGCPAGEESLVIAEAGELGPRSALRRLFEESADGASVACYAVSDEDLVGFAEAVLRKAGHSIEPGALDLFGSASINDRSVLRSELEKLSLFVGPGAVVRAEAVAASLGDSLESDLDDVALSVATGDLERLDAAMAKAFSAGQGGITVLRAVGRELTKLYPAVAAVGAGASAEGAVGQIRPPVFFKHKPLYLKATRSWRTDDIVRAIEMIAEAELVCKSGLAPDEPIVWRALLRVAHAARRSIPA